MAKISLTKSDARGILSRADRGLSVPQIVEETGHGRDVVGSIILARDGNAAQKRKYAPRVAKWLANNGQPSSNRSRKSTAKKAAARKKARS
jgi:hypothetical protein